ncbi:Zinc finger A20 and AN1 domain-containing stress-associated protein 2 [Striga hermonthica]|uniref:Zinc finger A20 and AN1 domain-containing stress-associated protein 2 n=1 Tax=Striga hermonthica TaxID=68872 RepID=A0A9N7R106_STRHE|nr:Zinc finger A20 and AN1 domain-containing stress-associated protein 2 [Striga hermonthica]
MEHDETGCQSPPECPVLCVNNCGFFGSPANMNMCSKCYKDLILKQEQAKLAASSIENIVNGSTEPQSVAVLDKSAEAGSLLDAKAVISSPSVNSASSSADPSELKAAHGPNKCTSCKKRVGLTGFKCRCGNLFCGAHRYSDKHPCPFDYRTVGRDAIARANPVVKAEKLDKI